MPERDWAYSPGCTQGLTHGLVSSTCSVDVPEGMTDECAGTAKIWGWVRHYNGEGNGNPLQYSCLENPMYGGAWWAAVQGVARVGRN